LFVVPKVEGLTTLYSCHGPFQSVLIWVPKVENNHFLYKFKSCNIVHVTFIELNPHLPLELILPYFHKLFHFLGEINFLFPFWLFNFLHILKSFGCLNTFDVLHLQIPRKISKIAKGFLHVACEPSKGVLEYVLVPLWFGISLLLLAPNCVHISLFSSMELSFHFRLVFASQK